MVFLDLPCLEIDWKSSHLAIIAQIDIVKILINGWHLVLSMREGVRELNALLIVVGFNT